MISEGTPSDPVPIGAGPQVPPAIARSGPRPGRLVASFLVGLAVVSIGTAAFGASPWSWLLWIVAGLVAGSIAGELAFVWIAPVIVIATYAVAIALGLPRDQGPFWVLGALIGIVLTAATFAVGTRIVWRDRPRAAVGEPARRPSRTGRIILVAAAAIVLVGLTGFTTYVGAIGSQEYTHPASGWPGCDTPMSRFGWTYEAINYDQADDAALVAANSDMTNCASQGTPAGDAVKARDGVRLAGWYIPAADGAGPTAPTVVIVPGWKSNKSEVLKYAPPFHEHDNLVLADLRDQGRSEGADVTIGLHEQWDVRAMVDWLALTKHPKAIAAMGNSMGAAAVLAEARTDPRIGALILDSMHANIELSVGNVLETEHGLPSVPGAFAILTGVQLRAGEDVRSVDPVKTITEIGARPVLLLHSTTDRIDPPDQAAERNFRAALAAGVPVELHYCPGVTTGNGAHGQVIDRCPAAWSRWANQFLEVAFGD